MKQLGFVFLLAAAMAAAPATAQSLTLVGHDFIDAVKKSDANKAIGILSSNPKGLVDTKDEDGNTALIIAINRGDDEWTGFMLNKGADPNVAGKGGDTPLIAASRIGFETAVEWLLSLGAKVDTPNRMGETPLIVAVQQRNLPVARRLLDAGANPDKADTAAGFSARDYAARDGRSRDILKLIEAKKPKGATAAK